jgi:hypothetical protein
MKNPPGNANQPNKPKPADEQPSNAVQGCPDTAALRVPDVVLPSRPATPTTRFRARSGTNAKGGKGSSGKGGGKRISTSPIGSTTRKTKKKTRKKPPPTKRVW